MSQIIAKLVSINHETIEFPDDECFRVLRWGADVSSVELLDGKSGRFLPIDGAGNQWHCHQAIEITLVQSGNGLRVIGDSSSEIPTESSLVVLGGGLPHCFNFSSPSQGICVQWCSATLSTLLGDSARLEVSQFIERASFGLEASSTLHNGAQNLLIQLASDTRTCMTARYGLFLQLLGTFLGAETSALSPISSAGIEGTIRHAGYLEMQEAIGWIMSNYQAEIRLQQVLDRVQMSKASFARHFRDYTGQSYSQFVNDIRISHACRLLQATTLSISTIALDSGFPNLSNFNRIFRKRKGYSPSHYRR